MNANVYYEKIEDKIADVDNTIRTLNELIEENVLSVGYNGNDDPFLSVISALEGYVGGLEAALMVFDDCADDCEDYEEYDDDDEPEDEPHECDWNELLCNAPVKAGQDESANPVRAEYVNKAWNKAHAKFGDKE